MIDFFITVLYSFVLVSALLYMWYKLLDRKINFNNPKLYVTLVLLMFISIINFFLTNEFIKICLITIFFMFFFRYLFKEKIQKCIITPIFTQVLTFLSEFIYVLFLSIVMSKEANQLFNTSISMLIANIMISIILVFSVNIPFIKKLYKKLLIVTNKINYKQMSLFCAIGMLILNVLLASVFHKIKFQYYFTLNAITIIIVLIIILYSFKTQNNYNKVSDKYNIAIKSLNDYENMMTKYRIANHENKNLLNTVRVMILNKEKDIPKYIESIINEKYMDDEKLLLDMSVIPSGGLRATIYSEILKIKENNIQYFLNIDKKIRSIDLINLETDTIIEICKMIGVFVDNSIDAVKELNNKNIDIHLYIQKNCLCIKVSNNYKNNIDVTKINDEGYTTKGKGHGYGLSLVKNIVRNNKLFENRTEVSKEIFSQILIIKYKKSR